MPPLSALLYFCGWCHFGILIASALVPFRLNWKDDLASLPKLHRQMYWVYGGYIVLNIVAFGALSITCSRELASGTPLARGFCAYVAVFWGIRLALQGVFDVKDYLSASWLSLGYHLLSGVFLALALSYTFAALHVA